MKVAVCLPSYGPCFAEHREAREELFRAFPDWEKFAVNDFPCIAIARCVLAEEALAWGADVILWIDADMVFSPKAAGDVVRAAYEQKAIVGAIYSRKCDDRSPVVGQLHTDSGWLRQATWVGLGLAAVHRSVFDSIHLPLLTYQGKQVRPWFMPRVDGSWSNLAHEDESFCRRAREAGLNVFADARLHGIGHIGKKIYELT